VKLKDLYEAALTSTDRYRIKLINKDSYSIRNFSNPSEAVQLAAVNRNGYSIQFIIKQGIVPSEAVQLASVSRIGGAIMFISDPSPEVLITALKNHQFIDNQDDYESFVRKYFKDNQLLMKKWLRYGETMRNNK
jgi:hypothetical protein